MIRKTFLSAALFSAIAISTNAQELPAPSPYAELEQRVGLTDFTLQYSRPSVKDRVIFGDLEAYGEVWRTGANSSTKIEFTTDIVFAGVEVEAGKYSVFTIPGKEMWQIMLNTDLNATENSYEAGKNVVTAEVKSSKIERRESLLFYFDNLRDESADLVLEWESVHVTIPIKVNAAEQAMKNIEAKMNEMEGNFRAYNSSARYYLDNNIDLEKALAWSKKSVEIDEKFWNVYTLSLIHHKMGNKKEALAAANRSMELAVKDDYQPYVKMNKENIAAWSKK